MTKTSEGSIVERCAQIAARDDARDEAVEIDSSIWTLPELIVSHDVLVDVHAQHLSRRSVRSPPAVGSPI
jgi:hypothetical protein